ncbi:hypothetical protein M9H77_07725 [Catharanthus roseus]|uniref:Uncharacterized protein n=1 Tax=Catharanthus roseus TaxID=4058 RepID=A0ACC0BVR3_CATRO|nr:hypothetical protein M9H77_07725 [Catharanthus roseus]
MQGDKTKEISLEDLEASKSNGEEDLNPTTGSRIHPTIPDRVMAREEKNGTILIADGRFTLPSPVGFWRKKLLDGLTYRKRFLNPEFKSYCSIPKSFSSLRVPRSLGLLRSNANMEDFRCKEGYVEMIVTGLKLLKHANEQLNINAWECIEGFRMMKDKIVPKMGPYYVNSLENKLVLPTLKIQLEGMQKENASSGSQLELRYPLYISMCSMQKMPQSTKLSLFCQVIVLTYALFLLTFLWLMNDPSYLDKIVSWTFSVNHKDALFAIQTCQYHHGPVLAEHHHLHHSSLFAVLLLVAAVLHFLLFHCCAQIYNVHNSFNNVLYL